MSFTRGRPCGSPASLLGAVDRLPARVGHVVGLALVEQLLERVAARVGRARAGGPASRSSSSSSTVSWASRLLVPMMPVGPALDPADHVLAGERLPGSSRMRPPSLGIVPRALVEGQPSQRHAAVADRAEHDPAAEISSIVVGGAGAQPPPSSRSSLRQIRMPSTRSSPSISSGETRKRSTIRRPCPRARGVE